MPSIKWLTKTVLIMESNLRTLYIYIKDYEFELCILRIYALIESFIF